MIEEIVVQSRIEFNVEAEEQDIRAFEKVASDTGIKKTYGYKLETHEHTR